MCKTYDAIYELSRYAKSDILICSVYDKRIEGKIYKCNSEFHENRCYDGVVTLKNAIVTQTNGEYKKEYEWLNVPSKQIQAFAYKCCEK